MERGPVFGKLIWLGDFMIKRELEKEIKKRSEAFPVVAILGPRQSGKLIRGTLLRLKIFLPQI